MPGRFYVYTLAYPDGRVFYVGKGTGKRKDSHLREARRGAQFPRHEVIRQIEAAGGQVTVQIVEEELDEIEALRRESALIALHQSEWLTNGNKGQWILDELDVAPTTAMPASEHTTDTFDHAKLASSKRIVAIFRDVLFQIPSEGKSGD